MWLKGPGQEGMQSLKPVRLAVAKVGRRQGRGFVGMCVRDEITLMVPQLSPGTYAASKAQCMDCKGVGERLKEKERQVTNINFMRLWTQY
jgi:hypothetical protein